MSSSNYYNLYNYSILNTRIAVAFASLENSSGQMQRLYAYIANKYVRIQDSEQKY